MNHERVLLLGAGKSVKTTGSRMKWEKRTGGGRLDDWDVTLSVQADEREFERCLILDVEPLGRVEQSTRFKPPVQLSHPPCLVPAYSALFLC